MTSFQVNSICLKLAIHLTYMQASMQRIKWYGALPQRQPTAHFFCNSWPILKILIVKNYKLDSLKLRSQMNMPSKIRIR